MKISKGALYLIPSFLAETNNHQNFPPVNLGIIQQLDLFVVENVRTARRFLRKVGFNKAFDQIVFLELNKHTNRADLPEYLLAVQEGKDIGLLSEAGIPCIADPGSEIVSIAHHLNIKVVPLTGPSSIFLALMASGLNGQNFVFHGYLPIDRKEKEQKLRDLEKKSRVYKQTQIFIETPYRNNQMLEAIVKSCHKNTLLCIGSMLTHDTFEFIKTKTVLQWKNNLPDLHKKPTVFLLY